MQREEHSPACSQDYEINFNSAVCLRTSHTILIFKMDGWPTSAAAACVCVCVCSSSGGALLKCGCVCSLAVSSLHSGGDRPTNVFPLVHYGNCVLQEIIIMRRRTESVGFLHAPTKCPVGCRRRFSFAFCTKCLLSLSLSLR
jgi:hypothetical protein